MRRLPQSAKPHPVPIPPGRRNGPPPTGVREPRRPIRPTSGASARVVPEESYRGGAMAGKKDLDATKNLREGEPTQVTPQCQKIGLPKRRDVLAALEKVIKKPVHNPT